MSYGDFHNRLEADSSFQKWFTEMESDIIDLCTGQTWRGEGPFPCNRWTRVLLLQQLLVELMDLLDPDWYVVDILMVALITQENG